MVLCKYGRDKGKIFLKTIKGSEYYFDKNGWMVTGWLKKGNNYYYLKENGTKASNYWVGTTGVGGYYINKYGIMVANSTYSVGDYIYSFNSSGSVYFQRGTLCKSER